MGRSSWCATGFLSCAGLVAVGAVDSAPDRARCESLFAKLRGSDKPEESPLWKEFMAQPSAKTVAREHLECRGEPDRGRGTALAVLAAFDGPAMADTCANFALYGRNEPLRDVARGILKGLHAETPDRVVRALRAPEKYGMRALDLIKDNPDEKGLYAIIVASEEEGYGGGGQRSYILNATQQAYIKDLTAVVQVSAVGYDPEIDYVQTGSVLDAKVVKTEHFRRTLYEISGLTFDNPGRAQAWWKANKEEVLKRIREHPGGKASPTP